MTGRWGRVGSRRVTATFWADPLPMSVSVAMVPVGLVVMDLGARASRALTVIGGDLPARWLGVLVFVGGVCTVAAAIRGSASTEAAGAGCISAGMAIYSTSVFVGLGVQGLISGIVTLSLAVGYLLRMFGLAATARHYRDDV